MFKKYKEKKLFVITKKIKDSRNISTPIHLYTQGEKNHYPIKLVNTLRKLVLNNNQNGS